MVALVAPPLPLLLLVKVSLLRLGLEGQGGLTVTARKRGIFVGEVCGSVSFFYPYRDAAGELLTDSLSSSLAAEEDDAAAGEGEGEAARAAWAEEEAPQMGEASSSREACEEGRMYKQKIDTFCEKD